MSGTLPLKRYPASRASELLNDSSTVSGANVADALDTLQTELGALIHKDGSVAFTGDQSLGGHKATNAAAPTAGGDLANKTYVDAGDAATLTAVILKNGSVAFTGDQSLGGHKATNAAAPTAGGDLANKTYVDAGDAATLAAAGNVHVTTPTTVDAVPSWNDTAGTLRPSSAVQIHNSSSDKLEYAARYGAYKIATDGVTVSFDLDQGNDWEITLGGNRTLAYTHANIDELVTVLWKQDATGGRSPTWWANIKWANGVAPVTDTTAVTGWNMVRLLCVGVDGYGVPIWYEVSRRGSKLAGSLFHTNAANELVQLDAAGKLPAIDGSQLTNLPGGSYFSSVLHGSGSLSFGSIGPAGGTANLPITVTGAVAGDSVLVTPRANLVGPFAYYAWVSGSNTVQVQIMNAGTIAFTPTTTIWDAWILRP